MTQPVMYDSEWGQKSNDASTALRTAQQNYSQNPNEQTYRALIAARQSYRNAMNSISGMRVKETAKDYKVSNLQALAVLSNQLLQEKVVGENEALAKTIITQANAPGNETNPELQAAKQKAQDYLASLQHREEAQIADQAQLTGQVTPGATQPGVPNGGVLPQFAPGTEPQAIEKFGKKPITPVANNTKESTGKYAVDSNTVAVDVSPSWEPTTADIGPGNSAASVAAYQASLSAVRPLYSLNSSNPYLAPGTSYSRAAMNNNAMVFTGYKTTTKRYVDEEGRYTVNTRQAQYQSVDALKNALGRTDMGFPDIKQFQKSMGLPETGIIDDNTQKAWQAVLQGAANTTSAGRNTTWQQAFNAYAAQIAAARAAAYRAQMAQYKVDATTSASIVGGATKQMLGRLSTAQEDKEFHHAFQQAFMTSMGRVDAQQFARDWIRSKHPTEAGTQLGQDYYGAMYDVLTAGPGSLGAEAASVNG